MDEQFYSLPLVASIPDQDMTIGFDGTFLGMPPEAGIFFGAYVGFRGADNIKETFVSIGNSIRKRKLGGTSNANK